MDQLIRARLGRCSGELESKIRTLASLNPRRVLERGYSITTLKGSRTPLRSPSEVRTGQVLMTRLANGEIRSLVADRLRRRRGTPPPTDHQPSLFSDPFDASGDPDGTE
jgi:exonuclease VII large subunit